MNASTGSTIVIGMLAIATARDTPAMLDTLQAAAVPSTTIQLVLPIDVVELVKAIFTGLAALGSAFAAIYAVIGAARAKRAETAGLKAISIADTTSKQIDGLLADRDKGKVKEGEAKGAAIGERIAEALKEGQRQGVENERESVQAVSAPSRTSFPDKANMPQTAGASQSEAAAATVEAAGKTVDAAAATVEAMKK